jgi:hypothetical protein
MDTNILAIIDHCLDMYGARRVSSCSDQARLFLTSCSLRQSELCHSDMSLMMFEWHEDIHRPVEIRHAKHVCANTEKLNSFLELNTVPPFNNILLHPWTGRLCP